ncbi:MAG: phosphopentomutase, partial [Verrucomicrobia bacterium]
MNPAARRRVFLIVLDSVGIAPAPDAAEYGDEGAATLPHTADAVGGLNLPTLQAMGLGNIPELIAGGLPIRGVPPASRPTASYGALCEQSEGKDTITGHWELAGILMRPGFTLFPPGPPSFPEDLVREFERRTGRPTIGNKAASGTEIIQELGEQHMREGAWIIYTSADSVFQIAAHTDIIPLEELYRACEIARELC